MRRIATLSLFLLSTASVAACRPAPAAQPGPRALAASWSADTVADRLFFGRSIPGGGAVTDSAWSAFMAEVVTPRFPQGLSVFRGEGQWLGADGQIAHEQATVVEVIHPAGDVAEAALAAIAEEYKRRFRQEAVLRVTVPVRMRFYE